VTLAVDSGTHDEIIMSDGSRVLLDAGSILRYPEVFEDDERTVLLNGEGYFEVASDAGRPFVVHANAAVVEVLGTEFNVRAWQREQRVTVAVAEGKVAFGAEGDSDTAVEIGLGQMSTLPKGEPPSNPRAVDIERHLGWMKHEAFFDNAPLHEILYQLERWYDVEFILEDETMAAEQLTIHVPAQPLEDVLELISALTNLEYEGSEGSVRLKPRDAVQ
jgi:ferric-dicitrate binding protein FerR (iron transport regulator)